MAPDPSLDAYPWADRPMLQIRRGKAEGDDAVSVTGAVMGFAETGTLMMVSGPDHPSTLNFLPETQVVVLRADQIKGSYEEGWAHLRAKGGGEAPADGVEHALRGGREVGAVVGCRHFTRSLT